jgi:hypothetical protein
MCRSRGLFLALLAGLALAGCGAPADGQVTAARAPKLARWTPLVHVQRPLDLAGPRSDGSLVLAAAGRLWLLQQSGHISRFAPGYQSPGGEEPYIASPAATHSGCSFGRGTVYVIRLAKPRGILRISATGQVRRFASINAPGLIDGITFDQTGTFGFRMLVTVNHGLTTTVLAIDCHGKVSTLTATAPRVEGGIVVAPKTFGRFAGDLIAPDETGGRVFAITPAGRSVLVANSGLPHGGDIGVESEAFAPPVLASAFLADRLTPGNRHPGDDVVLRIDRAALVAAGVRPGDLLVATEGGALTDAIRCGSTSCSVRHVASGPAIAHAEGHIAFVR